jgi:6-phosphogluconolactonase (cycloisomerase 2 family)
MRRPSLVLSLLALLVFAGAGASAQVAVTASAGTPAGSYTTLKDAFDAINLGTHQGVIGISLTGDTTETASAVLNGSGSGAASYTSIQITPSGGAARIISGAIVAGSPLIDLNGADNVTVDGLNSGGNALTISNTTASATSGTSTIRFIGGATGNTITNATILGSFSASVATNGGNIFFSTDALTANGNDNNTISSNNIGPAGANLPTKGVYFNGSTTTTAINNSGNVVTGNNIFDYFGAAVTSAGIYVAGGTTDCTFTNNRFYQTATRTQTIGAQHSGIWITNGNNYLVSANTFGFASSAGTGTYTFVGTTSSTLVPIYLNVGTVTTTSVQGNTIAGIAISGGASGTSTSAPFRGIYIAGGLVTLGDVTGNTIGSQSAAGSITFTSSSLSSADVIGVYNFGSSAWTASNNLIGGITAANSSTGAANIYGIRVNTSSSVTFTCQNNTIGGTVANSIQSTSTATGSTVQGILNSNPAATVTGNLIRNLTAGGGTGTSASASVIGIVMAGSSANHTVRQNVIHTLSNTNTTAATTVTGIQFTGSTGANLVARNLIHSFNAASTAAILNGINVSGGTTTYQNNMIRLGIDASGASVATALSINGFSEPLGTDTIVFNSIYVGGSGVGTTASNSFAFNSQQTVNTRTFRDNIFVNARSNATTGGKHYAIRVGGTTPNPTGLTSNNNILLASGSGGLTGLFNLVDQPTLAAWQAATGQDGGSFALDPQFLAPTAATPDLHINGSVLTPIEGNGFPIGTVTDDFDGQLRSGLTPTDIGADAGNFLGVDLSAPAISYTILSNTASTANRTLTTTVTDVTGAASGGLAPRIYYRKGAGSYFSQACSLTGGTVTSGTWDCVVVNADLGGVAVTDVISYFVIAQDTLGNIGSNPGGAVATSVNNVTTPPAAPNAYTIVPAFSGTYDVGAGQTYTSLTNAGGIFEAINAGALTSNLVINITSDLTGELGTNALNQWAEDGAGGYTLTIRPGGAARAITGSSAGALIKLNGADRVTIDGSVGGGGTDRSLTISNATAAGVALWIASASASNGATGNTVKNCILSGSTGVTLVAAVLAGSGTTLGNAADAPNSNNTLSNNQFLRAQNGAYISGAATLDQNWLVTGNAIGSTIPADKMTFRGIAILNAQNFVISNNTIAGVVTSTTSTSTGIAVFNTINTGSISGNRISDVKNTNTGGWGCNGIFLAATSTASNLTISNNTIADVAAFGFAGVGSGDNGWGVMINSGGGYKIYSNSISLGTNQTATTGNSAAVNIAAAVTTAGSIDLRGNILANSQTVGNRYGILNASTNAVFALPGIDYNDYFAQNVGGTAVGGTITPRLALADWQSVSATDLHINASGAASPVEGAGTPIAGVTLDFEGDTRSATAPTIGADEVPAAPTGLTATPGNAHVLLGWAVVPGSTYNVKRSLVSGGLYTTIASSVATNSYDDLGLVNSTPYYYVVSAVGFGPEGRNSAEATATPLDPPPAPLGLSAAPGNTLITLSWMASAGASSYNVKRSLVSGGPYTTIATGVVPTGFLDTGLTNYTPYYYVVSAVGTVGGEGADSTEATATPRLPTSDLSITKTDGAATAATGQPTTYTIVASNSGPDPVTGATVADTFPAFCDSVSWSCSGSGGGTCASPGVGNISASVNLPVGGAVTYTAVCNVNVAASGNLVNTATVTAPGGVVDAGGNNSATDTDTLVTIGISVSDVTHSEGNSGTTAYDFTVSLSSASGVVTTVDWATDDGTATTADSDYAAASGSLTFAIGETTKTVTVLANGDTKYEANETFQLHLTNAANAALIDGQGIGTLTNDDSQPSLSINDVTLAEGNSGTTAFGFTVSLSAASGVPTTVVYSTADGTATTADSDYAAASGTLTVAAGTTTGTVTVNVNGDAKFETSEGFAVNLTSPTNATIADSQGAGTITNDDSQPTISISDVTLSEGNSGTTPFGFTVSLSNLSYQPVTVTYATADGTATTADSDYAAASGTLTIAAGGSSGTVTVNVNGDTKFETNEGFVVNLTAPTNATIADSQGAGTITNDDSQPTIAINDRSFAEGNSGTTPFVFTVSLSNLSYQAVTVNYAAADGTATAADADYQAASGTLTIAAGGSSGTLTVNANGDTKFETNETFVVNLTAPTNATIADNQGTGTITNDDSQPTISITDVTANEGNSGTTPFGFTVSLSNASYQAITVGFATADGTATTADSDYTAASGALTIASGTTSQPLTVSVLGDTKFETNETFVVNLTAPTNATILDNQGVGNVTNDDTQPTIAISDVAGPEGNSGTSTLTFTVSLSNASYQAITVARATADGTATTADADYVAGSGTLTFAAGSTSQTFGVTINGDTKYENNETFVVNLTTPANATISDNQGTGTINNDDPIPALSVNDVSRLEGNSGSSNSTFTVSITNPSFQAVTVAFATSDGTATVADGDYAAASGTLTFPAGSTAGLSVSVAVNGDTKFEANETFNVNLSTPANATIADNLGLGTIQNDDGQPTISISDVEKAEGNSGNTAFDFALTLSNPSGTPITVNYATADGAPALPTPAVSSISVDPEGRFLYVTIPGSPAVLAFSVDARSGELSPAAEQIPGEGPRAAVLDGLPRFAYVQRVSGEASVNAVLGAAGMLKPVPGPELGQVGAVAATADGKRVYVASASSPELASYAVDEVTGLLTPVAGSPVALPWPAAAVVVDRAGRFVYALHPASGRISALGVDPSTGALQSVEGSPFEASRGPIALAVDPAGSFAWALTRGGDVLSYRIDPGSGALIAVDSVASAGSASALAVHPSGSFLYVPHRKRGEVSAFRVDPDSGRLSAISGSPFATGSEPAALAVHPSGSYLYLVEESARQIGGFAIDSATGALTPLDRAPFATNATAPATAGQDYQAASGTLTFAPGSTTGTITVQVFGDFTYEPDEVFTVNLSAPAGATLVRTQAAGTIDDDERARMVSPVPGSTLGSATVTFVWTAGSQATGYWLDVATTPGGTNLYSAAQSGLTATVSGIPANSQPIYVRLWTFVPAPVGWVYFDYTYTAVTPVLAQMITPVPGTTLAGSSATFTWTPGAGITRYFLDIGSKLGSKDVYSQDRGTNLSASVTTLPVDGRVLYVRLWSFISGKAGWAYVDYQYTAANLIAGLVTPNPGQTITPTTTFTWTPGVGALQYWLSVGTTQGGTDIYDGDQALGLTRTVSGIPSTPVWARLFTRLPGLGWVWKDYRFNY